MPDQITVSEFVAETNEDYKSPTASNFTTRMSHCRNTVSALEEVSGCAGRPRRHRSGQKWPVWSLVYLFIYLFERSVSSSSRSPLFSLWRSSPPLLLQPFPHAPYSSSKQHSHCSSRFLLLSRIWSVPLYCSFFNQEIEFVLSPQRLARKRRCRQIKSFIFISLKIIFHKCPSNGCIICTTHDPLFP